MCIRDRTGVVTLTGFTELNEDELKAFIDKYALAMDLADIEFCLSLIHISKYRPSYPEKLIDWLYDMTNAEAVADIGAGTGIFTSALLKNCLLYTSLPKDVSTEELYREP